MGNDLFDEMVSQATPFNPDSDGHYAVIDPRNILSRAVEVASYYDYNRDTRRNIEKDQLMEAWRRAFDDAHLQVGTSFVGVDMAKAPEEPERDLKSLIAYYYNR